MSTKVVLYSDRDYLIVPIQTDLCNEIIEQLQKDILREVSKARLRGVIIDFAGVFLLDSYQARRIFDIAKMTQLLGTITVFTGLSAGIVISLLDLGFEPGEILTAISLEAGIDLLQSDLLQSKNSSTAVDTR